MISIPFSLKSASNNHDHSDNNVNNDGIDDDHKSVVILKRRKLENKSSSFYAQFWVKDVGIISVLQMPGSKRCNLKLKTKF